MNTLNLTEDQKVYLLKELQSKIEEIVAKEIEPVEQFTEDGDCYEVDFYIGSSLKLSCDLNIALIETILK